MVTYRTREQAKQEKLNRRINALLTPTKTDDTEFLAACEQFRQVCAQIKEFAGLTEFYGGFEEAM